jgi:hypothetical protein
MSTTATVGIDLAKSVFSIHAVNEHGRVQMHRAYPGVAANVCAVRGVAAPKSSPTTLAYGINALQSGACGGGIWSLTLAVHLPSTTSAHR